MCTYSTRKCVVGSNDIETDLGLGGLDLKVSREVAFLIEIEK